jgi:ribosomal protein S18 acetylase RimI-like enzyme
VPEVGESKSPVVVREAGAADDALVEALTRLLPQLSRTAAPPSAETVAEIVASPATRLVVAEDPDTGAVLGCLTLAVFRIPTGIRAWIEDVVVDEAARGRGVGEALSRRALELAAAAGARTVELTSRPSREAANRLYRRLGFAPRDTNVYRYELRP